MIRRGWFRRFWPVIVALVVVTGGAIWYFFIGRESEETVIRKRMAEVSQLWKKTPEEKPIGGVWKAEAAKRFFADPVELNFREEMFSGHCSPETLGANFFRARKFFVTTTLDFSDYVVTLLDKDNAKVEFTAVLKGRMVSGSTVDEVRALEARLVRQDGKWVFASIVVGVVLQK
ncbi:MAG: hypothetical protein PHS41_02415 [Victivallaceae bacterium]|nr:hypothetical protein [Victivallaceae bacterium]